MTSNSESSASSAVPQITVDQDWWRGAIIYQVYPRSYQDSNGDGIGDLPGITNRLEHIASLGVDAVWLSPFFTSPMADFGYDVSDYCNVDKLFGTLEDFDLLLTKAHELGIRIIIDQVLSHSSDQHPWFVESRASRDNPKSDWYVWVDPNADGTPPNNWLSIFGGSAWQWDPRRQQYYLHNFLASQPDLNFHNPDVQDALLETSRFWLERGVDGFRLDTINFYFADKQFRNNPPLPLEQRLDTIAPAVNPYNHQQHLYSKNQPENLDFLRRYRALLDEYDARTSVGEIGDAQQGLDIIGEYTAGDKLIHMCYTFEFLANEKLTAARIKSVFEQFDKAAPDGWACWAFNNHDIARHTSRWNLTAKAQRTYTTLLMCLRGTLCLYQGEELGLPEAEIEFEELQDPYGAEFWPEYKGRDGCRTPMVWVNDNRNGGFSNAPTWLPVPGDQSLLNHYRRAIAFRQSQATLQHGDQIEMQAECSTLTFKRRLANETILCIFNLSDDPVTVDLPSGSWESLGQDLGCNNPRSGARLLLSGWQASIMVKK